LAWILGKNHMIVGFKPSFEQTIELNHVIRLCCQYTVSVIDSHPFNPHAAEAADHHACWVYDFEFHSHRRSAVDQRICIVTQGFGIECTNKLLITQLLMHR